MLGCWQEQGTNVGLLPDGRHVARSVAKGYFLHPQKAGVYRNGTTFSRRGALIQGIPFLLAETAHKGRRGADICRRMGNDGDGRTGGRELGRRFTDSAGSRRQEQARQFCVLRGEQPRMDSTGRRQGAEDSRSSRPDERAGQQAGMAGEQARRGRRQEQRAARLPSFLCTNTFVGAFVLVPIMYRYRNKDELGNSCALRPTTQ